MNIRLKLAILISHTLIGPYLMTFTPSEIKRSQEKDLLEILYSLNLEQIVKKPSIGENLLDLVMVDCPEILYEILTVETSPTDLRKLEPYTHIPNSLNSPNGL